MKFLCGLLFFIVQLPLPAQSILKSPDGNVEFNLITDHDQFFYSIRFYGKKIIDRSEIKLVFADSFFCKNAKIEKIERHEINEDYTLMIGKTSKVSNRANEMTVHVNSPNESKWILRIRAYNEGIAFRYEFPKQQTKEYQLIDEITEYNLDPNATAYVLLLRNYTTSHEGLYTTTPIRAIPKEKLIDLPVLVKMQDGLYVSITEAALRDYAGMYLSHNGEHKLISKLSPLPKQNNIKVIAKLPHHSPWRVIMVAKHPGVFIESNMITSLNEPAQKNAFKWLKPGTTNWSWWNGDVLKDVPFEVGQNFETHKWYIDFCAANKIEYHSVIGYKNVGWYKADGIRYDPPPPGVDLSQSVATLDMPKISAYAKSKGVGLRFWVHWKPLSQQMEKAFAQFKKWNIKGLMVDFMDRDDQEMVNWIEKVLHTAAKHKIHIQFHGAYKPTGLNRTYPNELTKEGVLNLEACKWDSIVNPEHDLMIPFTRMIAGPVDYHSGGFRALPRDQFKVNFIEPNVLGTRSHHLALYVVYENYLPMVADYPQAYIRQDGFDFIQNIPATWDETKYIVGEVGDYIAIARKKGDQWYIGAMTDWSARTIEFSLPFLKDKKYNARIYSDTHGTDTNPNLLAISHQDINSRTTVKIEMASGGGWAAVLSPIR